MYKRDGREIVAPQKTQPVSYHMASGTHLKVYHNWLILEQFYKYQDETEMLNLSVGWA